MPGREKFRDQSIKARFFILGLPLFPTGAIYQVTPSLGIPVPLTGHDTLHAFAKIHFPLLGVGAFLLAQEAARNATAFAAVLGLIALGLIALGLIGFGVYSWIKVRDAAPEDHLKRRIFGKAFQYNMPPEYLPKDLAWKFQGELVNNYLMRHRSLNWQGHVDSGVVTKRDFPLLYTLAYYANYLSPSPETTARLAEMELYVGGEKEVASPDTPVGSTSGESDTTDAASPTGPGVSMDDILRQFGHSEEDINAGRAAGARLCGIKRPVKASARTCVRAPSPFNSYL